MAAGQARLLLAREPIAGVIADPGTRSDVREGLELVQRVRRFAGDLGLDVGDRYTSYVPWPGDRIVTTVVASRPGEVSAAGFWFPIVGRVPYKGYFDVERAEAEAERLREDRLDVCVVPVPAYSTLGWFDDPVTEPMLRQPRGRLVETLFHELVHATVFLASEAEFNESVASFIGEEARLRFFEVDGLENAQEQRAQVADSRQIRGQILRTREAVEHLYADDPEATTERDEITATARARIAALPLERSDAWSLSERIRLNDACLALAGTYGANLERYITTLETLDGNLPAFITRLRDAADTDDPEATFLTLPLPLPPTHP